jgi:hypothetical protein
MGADSSDSSNFLLLSKPLGDLELIFLDHLQDTKENFNIRANFNSQALAN